MRFGEGSNKGTASHFVQISEKLLRGPWQLLNKRSRKKALTVYGKSKLTETEKEETNEEKRSRACSSFSLASRGLFTNNSSRQAKQSISHITVTSYGDCMKMCEDFDQNFGDKTTGCRTTTPHRLMIPFSPGNI
jgi:hypothetical protein